VIETLPAPAASRAGPGRFARTFARIAQTSLLSAHLLARLREARPEDALARAELMKTVAAEALRCNGIEVRARGEFPAGPALLVANHVSWIDPLALLAKVPCVAVTKAAIERWPVFGPLAAGAGALFLTRGDVASGARVLRAMLRAFERGVSVLNFPEGTTTPGAEVLPFHVGSFGAARIARVPVVPVALRYEPADLAWTGDAAFLPHYLKVASREASVLSLRICEPLHPIGSASDLELSRRARAAIQFALREL